MKRRDQRSGCIYLISEGGMLGIDDIHGRGRFAGKLERQSDIDIQYHFHEGRENRISTTFFFRKI